MVFTAEKPELFLNPGLLLELCVSLLTALRLQLDEMLQPFPGSCLWPFSLAPSWGNVYHSLHPQSALCVTLAFWTGKCLFTRKATFQTEQRLLGCLVASIWNCPQDWGGGILKSPFAAPKCKHSVEWMKEGKKGRETAGLFPKRPEWFPFSS